jgi:Na+/citrate or Na+/malate symporter
MANIGAVMRDFAPLTAEAAVIMLNLGAVVLHQAHVGAITGKVVPILPVVAAVLANAFDHGLGGYSGLNGYGGSSVLRVCDRH